MRKYEIKDISKDDILGKQCDDIIKDIKSQNNLYEKYKKYIDYIERKKDKINNTFKAIGNIVSNNDLLDKLKVLMLAAAAKAARDLDYSTAASWFFSLLHVRVNAEIQDGEAYVPLCPTESDVFLLLCMLSLSSGGAPGNQGTMQPPQNIEISADDIQKIIIMILNIKDVRKIGGTTP